MSSKESVFKNINDTLKTVELAVKDLNNNLPERNNAAIRNVITFGRSVTFAIQKLKIYVDGFDEWYLPKQREMVENPLFKHFKDLRNEIIHDGKLDTTITMNVNKFSTLFLQYMPKPPNYTHFFLGDENGGSGWIVKNEYGEEEKYYIALNKDFIDVQVYFTNIPDTIEIDDLSAKNLCTIYYDYLQNLVEETKNKFN